MIRINLLGGERQKAKTARFDAGQQLTAMCGLVAVAAVAGVGYWDWALSRESSAPGAPRHRPRRSEVVRGPQVRAAAARRPHRTPAAGADGAGAGPRSRQPQPP